MLRELLSSVVMVSLVECGFVCAGPSTASGPQVALHLSLPRIRCKPGENASLVASLENTGKRPVLVGKTIPFDFCVLTSADPFEPMPHRYSYYTRIVITDSDKQQIDPMINESTYNASGMMGVSVRELSPGASISRKASFSRIHVQHPAAEQGGHAKFPSEVLKPGVYSVYAEYTVTQRDDSGEIPIVPTVPTGNSDPSVFVGAVKSNVVQLTVAE